MSTEISAHVMKLDRAENQPEGYPWVADVWATSDGQLTHSNSVFAPSWPEAMQAAYKLRADIDAELMNAVHENRASRRQETKA